MRRRIVTTVIYICIAALLFTAAINLYIISGSRKSISDSIDILPRKSVGIILGASVFSEDRLSRIYSDRIRSAAQLYKQGLVKKLLVSGDHGTKNYDEVNAGKKSLVKLGIPTEDIYLDHAGFSTYESIYRAQKVFKITDCIIITQRFHLSRAIFLARARSIDAKGYIADSGRYRSNLYNETREYFARIKDFFYAFIIKPEPRLPNNSIHIIK